MNGVHIEELGLPTGAFQMFSDRHREASFVSQQFSSQILCHGVGTVSWFVSICTAVILCPDHPPLWVPVSFYMRI